VFDKTLKIEIASQIANLKVIKEADEFNHLLFCFTYLFIG